MQFKANYYDGKSAKAREVDISIFGDNINISSKEDRPLNLNWDRHQCEIEHFNTNDTFQIKYGEFPYQTLEFKAKDAAWVKEQLLDSAGILEKIYDKVLRVNPLAVFGTGAIVLTCSYLLYFYWLSPIVGERAADLIPAKIEKQIGEHAFQQFTQFMKIDSSKSEMMQEFYEELNFESEYPIEIYYVDESTVNAFAVPGGKIVVFDGLVKKTKCWDELAALLSHELAHVNQRHSMKSITRSLSGYVVFSALTGDASGVSAVIIENLSKINQYSNSRENEKEADLMGLNYLKEQNIRPQSMVDLMTRLLDYKNSFLRSEPSNKENGEKEASENAESENDTSKISQVHNLIEVLSSHPLTEKRIEYLIRSIENQQEFDYQSKELPKAEEIWMELKNYE